MISRGKEKFKKV